MSDLIDRQATIDAVNNEFDKETILYRFVRSVAVRAIKHVPSAQPEIIRCKDCKHFELNHFEKVDGFPIPIVVHEICMKWGKGCKTSIDGWCFMAERRTA